MSSRLALACVTALMFLPQIPAQGLLEDLNAQPTAFNPDSSPSQIGLRNASGAVRFAAETLQHGRELWSIGTGSGAVPTLVADINPAGNSDPGEFTLTQTTGQPGLAVLLAATHAATGREPWVSVLGGSTSLLADLYPGPLSSHPREFTKLTGTVTLFTADGGPTLGRELYTATTAGATLLLDIRPGALGSDPRGLVQFDGKVWFSADDGISGRELWVTDGTAVGTRLVADINPGASGSDPVGITGFLPRTPTVFFAATEPTHGRELWQSTGTVAGTSLFADIQPGVASSNPQGMKALIAGPSPVAVLFAADDGATGMEPWILDSTSARLLADINPGSASSSPREFTQIGISGLDSVFSADSGTTGTGRELWKFAASGAVSLVADLMPGSAGSNPRFLGSGLSSFARPEVLFAATLPGQGEEFGVTRGTAATTSTFDLNPGAASSSPEIHVPVSGNAVFAATNGSVAPGVGRELWVWNGTTPSVALDIRPPEPQSSDPLAGVVLGGRAFFPAQDGVRGDELWVSDGTSAGTFLFKDIAPGLPSAQPRDLVLAGSRFYFTADDGSTGRELWTSDGTAAGTVLVRDVNPGSASSSPDDLVAVGTQLYFTASEPGTGRELWLAIGAGATLLEIQRGSTSSGVSNLFAFGTRLLFSADGGAAIGTELYQATGSTTTLVADIRPGADSSSPAGFALVGTGTSACFVADDGLGGRELWRTAGSAATTTLVKDIRAGASGSSPSSLTTFGRLVLFAADDGTSGRELWKTDGTAAGTVLVRDLAAGALSAGPGFFTPVVDFVLFSADDGITGRELWRTDGTTAGTTQVLDLFPGPATSFYFQLRNLNRAGLGNVVVFTANDGTGGGFEPWVSDGTAAGTSRIADVFAGPGDSLPVALATLGDRVLLAATTPAAGRELHALTFEAAGAGNAVRYGTGCANGTVPAMGFLGSPSPGGTATLRVTSAAANTNALLFLGSGPSSVSLGGSCVLLVAPPFPIVLNAITNAVGTGAVSLPIPADPSLVRAHTFWQWMVVVPGGPVLGLLSLSDGLDLLIGR